MKRDYAMRWLFFVIGLMVIGLGVALTIRGKNYGLGSWDVFHMGLFYHFGLSVGTWSIIVGLTIIILTALILKQLPRIGTFCNMLVTGVFIDVFNNILPTDVEGMLLQGVYFVAGTVLIGAGCAIYVSANLGAGPRDSLMLIMVDKLKFSITVARTLMEVFAAGLGFAMGGPIGIGTVIMVFVLGPVIQFFLPLCQKTLAKCLQSGNVIYK
ncbi:YczE/YyaS/YitT family protein [Kurthia massiliensis]|uniref:YczE/YyaS/YitT family protein n=1 Tax=Kurthia massiliensis TaxID=1033739 RepID=UPI000288A44F|nr:membrane protein [Kurthia massiliensis]